MHPAVSGDGFGAALSGSDMDEDPPRAAYGMASAMLAHPRREPVAPEGQPGAVPARDGPRCSRSWRAGLTRGSRSRRVVGLQSRPRHGA